LGVFIKEQLVTKQLLSVAPRQTAKVIALLWLAFTIPFVLLIALTFAFSNAPHKPPVGFIVLMPVFYALFGYLFTLIGAWAYNLIAKRVGGIEFTTVEMKDAQQGVGPHRDNEAVS
jgi:hypothetical protein